MCGSMKWVGNSLNCVRQEWKIFFIHGTSTMKKKFKGILLAFSFSKIKYYDYFFFIFEELPSM